MVPLVTMVTSLISDNYMYCQMFIMLLLLLLLLLLS